MLLNLIRCSAFFSSVLFVGLAMGAEASRPGTPLLCVVDDETQECGPNAASIAATGGKFPKNVINPDNFHPGHWVRIASPKDAWVSSVMNQVKGTNIRGIEIVHRWDKLEPGAAGDYSGEYWDQLETWINQADSQGLAIFIRIQTHRFAAGGDPYTPDYMKKNSKYGGSPGVYGSYCSSAKCALRPAWHDADTVLRAKALISEFKRRWGTKANFEGVGIQESAVGANASRTPGWNSAAHAKGIVSIMVHANTIMPEKTVIPSVNWHPRLPTILDGMAEAGIGLGCPDLPGDGSNPDSRVVTQMRSRHLEEDHSPGVSGDIVGTLAEGWTLRQVYDRAADDLNVWRLMWDDDWLKEGLVDFARANDLPAAEAFYNSL